MADLVISINGQGWFPESYGSTLYGILRSYGVPVTALSIGSDGVVQIELHGPGSVGELVDGVIGLVGGAFHVLNPTAQLPDLSNQVTVTDLSGNAVSLPTPGQVVDAAGRDAWYAGQQAAQAVGDAASAGAQAVTSAVNTIGAALPIAAAVAVLVLLRR